MRTSPNAAATNTETKEKSCLPLGGLRISSKRCPHLYCQPLNEGWEGVDPGSIPSITQLHCRHLSPLGWPCLPTRRSITASGHHSAFPLQALLTAPCSWLALCHPARCSSRWRRAPAGCAGCRSSLARRPRAELCSQHCHDGSHHCSFSAGNRAPRPTETRALQAWSHADQSKAAQDTERAAALRLTL